MDVLWLNENFFFWNKGRLNSDNSIQHGQINEWPSHRLRHIRFIEDFTNSHRCATHVYTYNSIFTQDIEIKFSVLELYSNKFCYIQKSIYAEVTL